MSSVIAWRLVSSRIGMSMTLNTRNETQFYANPVKFCEVINKYFTEFYEEDKDEPGYILSDYDEKELSTFTPDDLQANFNYSGRNDLFMKKYYDYEEPAYLVEIETVEVEL